MPTSVGSHHPPLSSRSAALNHLTQDTVYLGGDVGRQFRPSGLRVVLDLFGARSPDDGAADVVMPKNPGQGELAHAKVRPGRNRAKLVHGRQDFLVHEPLHQPAATGVGSAGAPLGRLPGAVLACEHALGERGEDHLAHALVLTERDDLGLDLPLDHVVARLVGDDPVEVHLLGQAQSVGYLIRRPLRDAHVEHLSLAHEVVKGPQGLLERRIYVVAVALVEVHVVDPETLERGVTLLGYVLAREASVVWPLPHREVHLCGEEVGVPLEALERPAYDLLGRPPHVDVGRVEEVDPELVGSVDAGLRLLLGYTPAVGQPAPQGDLADLHPTSTQPPVLHEDLPSGAIPPTYRTPNIRGYYRRFCITRTHYLFGTDAQRSQALGNVL